MDPDQVTVMVEEPVVVTPPYHSSSSFPTEPSKATALVHVVTPPPETDDTCTVVRPSSALSTMRSPADDGSTDSVVMPEPAVVAKLPTAEMPLAETDAVKVAAIGEDTPAGDWEAVG